MEDCTVMSSVYTQLNNNLESLKLLQMKEHLNEVSDLVSKNQLSFSEVLLKLSNYEIDYKSMNASKVILSIS